MKILGLSETETAILETLTTTKSVQEISKESMLSRTGINYSLQNLINRGFIKVSPKGKRQKYTSISSAELSKHIENALNEVENEVTDKTGVKIRTAKNEFTIHVGAKEIIPAYKRIAFENKNERIRAIQHHRSWRELVEKITPKQLVDFNEAIKTNKLIIDGMLNVSAYKAYKEEIKGDSKKHKAAVKSLEGRMADYTVFPDNMFNFDTEIWIFKDTTLVINWKEEVAVEITNVNMTGFLRDMFEYVKAGNRKLNHQKALEESLKE